MPKSIKIICGDGKTTRKIVWFFCCPGEGSREALFMVFHSVSLISSVLLINQKQNGGIDMKDYIIIDNEKITVSEEVSKAYYQMKNREEYLEKVSKKNNLSYDQLTEVGYSVENNMCSPETSVEDDVVNKIMSGKLKVAIQKLSAEERMLIEELFLKETTIRELSNILSVPKSTLHDKKNTIIKKLKKIIEEI
jgi:RNA polymerase sigma factor (sigma-70 family)